VLENLPGRDDVIMFSFSGRLEKADVEEAIRRLDAAFERGGKVHVFVEVRDFKGMALDAWLSDLGHGLHYLTRLKQFGRFAIVSDQRWMRTASRIESALLPYITYEVYTPDQREHALAWVKGAIDTPRPETVRILGNGDAEIFAFEIDGRVTRDGVKAVRDQLADAIRRKTDLRLLARIRQYDGFEPALLVDPQYLELKLSVLRHVSRYAVVGGPEWLERLMKLFDPLLRMEIRHFDLDEEDAARAWLREKGPQPAPEQ
jgi:hypothetical protein